MVELRDDSDAPLGGSQPWIAADRSMQRRKGEGKEGGGLLGGEESTEDGLSGEAVSEKANQDQQLIAEAEIAPENNENNGLKSRKSNTRTTPVRNIEAGAFVMEVWVEEGPDKAAAIAAQAAEEKQREEERR